VSTGIWIAASGAASQMTAVDATANNLANATTPGYKAEQAVFQEHLIQAVYAGRAQKEMRYNGVAQIAVDTRSGPLTVTQRPLDVAIEGDGYFAVQTPRGERFTRAGGFQIGPQGTLVTTQGYAVLDAGGSPISLPLDSGEVAIGEDGVIRVGGEDAGQLKVVNFEDLRGLEKEGDQLFRSTARSGEAQPISAMLHGGALELPNVSIVKGMTDLVSATRAFEALEKAVEAFSQLEHRAATDIIGAR
jgi:flagellar basal-body rod protein FlgF